MFGQRLQPLEHFLVFHSQFVALFPDLRLRRGKPIGGNRAIGECPRVIRNGSSRTADQRRAEVIDRIDREIAQLDASIASLFHMLVSGNHRSSTINMILTDQQEMRSSAKQRLAEAQSA